MKIETYKGYYVRSGTFDKFVVDELPTYAAMPINKGDVILDIGANIGVFTKHALAHGARVVAIEPDVDNMNMLMMNAHNGDVHPKLAAVTPYLWDSVTLYRNPGRNKGLHSTMHSPGLEASTVPAICFTKLLEEYKPNKLKIDCEGAEYQFLFPSDLNGVQEVIMEMHLNNANQVHMARTLRKWFLEQDFEAKQEPVIAKPTRVAEKATIAYFVRKT